jgi:hypothetical protein
MICVIYYQTASFLTHAFTIEFTPLVDSFRIVITILNSFLQFTDIQGETWAFSLPLLINIKGTR